MTIRELKEQRMEELNKKGCCAHPQIEYLKDYNSLHQTYSDHWRCKICGLRFAPDTMFDSLRAELAKLREENEILMNKSSEDAARIGTLRLKLEKLQSELTSLKKVMEERWAHDGPVGRLCMFCDIICSWEKLEKDNNIFPHEKDCVINLILRPEK